MPLRNAGFGTTSTCGSAPLLGVTLAAAAVTLPTGEPAVALSWSPAIDETGGEGDVVRYVLWRRQSVSAPWGDPYRAIPAGATTYTYEDTSVGSGETYQYALAAQDCTPTLSGPVSSGQVSIP